MDDIVFLESVSNVLSDNMQVQIPRRRTNRPRIELLQTILLASDVHFYQLSLWFCVLEAFNTNAHSQIFSLLHAMYKSYTFAHTTTLQTPYFCNWREDCSCHYFLVLHLYLYPLVSVYKTQTESYKRKKHKNSNKK